MQTEQLIERFIESRKYAESGAKRECRPRTIETYIRDLSRLVDFMGARGVVDVKDIDRASMLAFRDHLKTTIQNHNTRFKVLRAVRALANFIDKDELCEQLQLPPMKKYLPPIPNSSKCNKIPTVEDIRRIQAAVTKRPFERHRDLTLIGVFLECGPRLGEVGNLTLAHLKLEQKLILIPEEGKTGQRVVYLTKEFAQDIGDYLKVRAKIAKHPAVFVTAEGTGLSLEGIREIFKRLSRRAKLENHISPHALRHFFCTMYLRKGGRLEKLAEITGHDSLETLRNYYLHLVGSPEIQEELERVSPRKTVAAGPKNFKERMLYKFGGTQ